MSLNKIQQTFVRLAASKWIQGIPSYSHLPFRKINKKKQELKIRIEIIDAVTGTKTSGKAADDSKAKFKKWLKLRNARAEFTDVILRKTSKWFKLTDVDFIDYPIIIKVGNYKAPYLIKRVQDRKTYRGITTIKMQLETAENINYLAILSQKKELLNKKKSK